MAKLNKYNYGWRIETNNGFGWEEECFAVSYKERRELLKDYREAARRSNGVPAFLVRSRYGRDINPEYTLARAALKRVQGDYINGGMK